VSDLFVRWSVRIALALYLLSLLLRIGRRDRLARWVWSAGCLAFLLHVAAAFHFVHHWSHTAAYAETARQTAEITRLDWGGGLYFNYLFAAVWLADVIWWWVNPNGYESRPRWIEGFVQAFMAFIVFNATVVFGHGAISWVGAVAMVVLLLVWIAVGSSRRAG
jgi:hypothetical protein